MKNQYIQLAKSVLSNDIVYLIFFVTARCNARCKMCFNWKAIDNADQKRELTLEEIRKISKNFPDIIYLTISGGEPFIRTDLAKIVGTFIENNNVQFVSIPTNGFFTEKILKTTETLFKKYPKTSFRIILSIDAIGEKHNYIRGTKGIFGRLLNTYEGLDILRKKYGNFNLDVSTTMSKYNKKDILKTFEWVKKNLNVDAHALAYTRGHPRVADALDVKTSEYEKVARYVEKNAIQKEERRKTLALMLLKALKLSMRDIIIETKKKNKMIIPCLSGKKMVVMTEEGDIFPCELLNMKMGNIREADYDIKKVLKSREAKSAVNWIRDNKCFCTFECAVQNNLAYNPMNFPRLAAKFAKVMLKKT